MCKDLEPPLISLHCAIKELEICHSFSPVLDRFQTNLFLCVCVSKELFKHKKAPN